MKKVSLLTVNQFCRSCQVVVGGCTYTVLGVLALSYMGLLTATYYVSRQDKPELSLLCYHTQGKALGMSSELADLRVISDIQKFGAAMVEQYENQILNYRKVGK